MTDQSQQSQGGPNCLTVMGALTLVMLVVMLVLSVLAWNTVGGLFGGLGQGLEDIKEAIVGVPEIVSTAVADALKTETRAKTDTKLELAESIQSMGTLVTASHKGAADVNNSVRGGFLNLCGVAVDHRADVTVEAGVDLAQVSASDLSHDAGTNAWILTLGAARIHSCRVDYIKQHEATFTLCRQDWDDYRLLAEFDALKEMRDQVLVEGLLPNAELVAGEVLANLVKAIAGSDNVSIVFESEPDVEFPESCLREPPTGWKFDEESDSWLRE